MRFVWGILVLIVVLAGVYLWFGASTEAPQTVERETFDSATYGISFKYPSTYALQEREIGDGHRYHYAITLIDKKALANIPQNGEGPPVIAIDIFQNNLDQLSIEEWVRGTSFSNFKLSPDGRIASTSIASVPALLYAWDGLYLGESMVFSHRDNIVMLSVTSLAREDKIREDYFNLRRTVSLF
ncbi:hypothetical protein HY417_01355 [Candidatus Kaiserbacteria bacterium]|nr:hypothetical protein [Candidatus Kaiserbacteria bacterium]